MTDLFSVACLTGALRSALAALAPVALVGLFLGRRHQPARVG
jgi:hypothetical protein